MKSKLLSQALFLLLSFSCIVAKADILWVGQSITCEVNILGYNQYNANWSVSGGYIELTGGTWATKTATVTQFFRYRNNYMYIPISMVVQWAVGNSYGTLVYYLPR